MAQAKSKKRCSCRGKCHCGCACRVVTDKNGRKRKVCHATGKKRRKSTRRSPRAHDFSHLSDEVAEFDTYEPSVVGPSTNLLDELRGLGRRFRRW